MSIKTKFECSECHEVFSKWAGKCPTCGAWSTLTEVTEKFSQAADAAASLKPMSAQRLSRSTSNKKAVRLSEISRKDTEQRLRTGIGEFDRVIGGGLVYGGVILLVGQPGSGKSTLLAHVSQGIASQGKKVLYVSGEENETQIASRSYRVNSVNDNIHVLSEGNVDNVLEQIQELNPDMIIVDSIQTLLTTTSDGRAGSPSQVTEVANTFIQEAKQRNIPVILIGHLTKNDSIAGPRVVEHMVDVVIYLEASADTPLRLLRAVKCRYGSTEEIGCFQHSESGLEEITDPSGYFTSPHDASIDGYATGVSIEGMRALPIEVTALVTNSPLPNPRKLTTGIEHARSLMVQAILEKYTGLPIGNKDVYVATTAGAKVKDSSLDLALAAAVISSTMSVAPPPKSAFIGEISLTGEIRAARFERRRIQEAERLGFTNIYSHRNLKTVKDLGLLFKPKKG